MSAACKHLQVVTSPPNSQPQQHSCIPVCTARSATSWICTSYLVTYPDAVQNKPYKHWEMNHPPERRKTTVCPCWFRFFLVFLVLSRVKPLRRINAIVASSWNYFTIKHDARNHKYLVFFVLKFLWVLLRMSYNINQQNAPFLNQFFKFDFLFPT